MRSLQLVFVAFVATTPLAARSPENGAISKLVVAFFDSLSAKNGVGVKEATWGGSCYDVGEKKCQNLQEVPFGRTEDGWAVNDMKIAVRGRRAAISLHSTHFAYDPEGRTKERAVCLRALDAEKRNGVWKLSRMSKVTCRHYDKDGVFQP